MIVKSHDIIIHIQKPYYMNNIVSSACILYSERMMVDSRITYIGEFWFGNTMS